MQVLVLNQSLEPTTSHRNRTRQFHHKTKGGCITCKSRHVKCDQTRPFCIRCRASHRECLGYTAPEQVEVAHTPKRQLRNEPKREEVDVVGTLDTDLGQVALPCRGRSRKRNDSFRLDLSPMVIEPTPGCTELSEKTSIDAFLQVAARMSDSDVCGKKHTIEMWTICMPQLSQTFSALHHAMVGNGIMCHAMIRGKTVKDSDQQSPMWRETATKAMNRSIKEFLAMTTIPKMVSALIALAFWSFYSSQGQYEESFVHVESAINIASTFEGEYDEEALVTENAVYCATLMRRQLDFARRFQRLTSDSTPTSVRRAGAMMLCQRTLNKIKIESLKLAFDFPERGPIYSTEEKDMLLGALERLAADLRCIVAVWKPLVAVKDIADGFPLPEGTIASPFLENVHTGVYPAIQLCAEFGRAIFFFRSQVCGTDLQAFRSVFAETEISEAGSKTD